MNLFDVGFQLSFVSVLAIILFYPKVLSRISHLSLPFDVQAQPIEFFVQSFAVSLAAWLGVAGLIMYYFDILTPISLLANLAVVPLFSLIVILGLGLLFLGSWPLWATVFASCIKFVLNVTVGCVYLFSQIPGGCIHFSHVPFWIAIIYYSIGFLGLLASALTLTKKFKYGTLTT